MKMLQANTHASGARGHYFQISYGPASATTNDDFTTIARIAANPSGHQVEHTITLTEDMASDHTVFRAIYFSGTTTLTADPESTGVSNTYTSCADVKIVSGDPASPLVYTGAVSLLAVAFSAYLLV